MYNIEKGIFDVSVNSYLQSLGSSLVLSENERNSIKTSLTTLKHRLSIYFGSFVLDKKVFGSYDRDTILPRNVDASSDVDLMVVFYNPNGYKPQTFLNRIKEFANYYYSRSEIYQSSPTIVLELNHIKFELVPAYVFCGGYYIPNGTSSWIYTDVDGLKEKLVSCNTNNAYKIKPVIRLLKHWNIVNNSRGLASYLLEQRVADGLMYAWINCTSYTEYIISALEAIKYYDDTVNTNAAICSIKKAVQLEQDGYPWSALSEIKTVFPEV